MTAPCYGGAVLDGVRSFNMTKMYVAGIVGEYTIVSYQFIVKKMVVLYPR